jgi:threonine/homoserine/homoserine lactone efflux protein
MDALGHWTFWATALVLVATPGTGAIYTLAAGLSHGPRAGVWAALASTFGIVPHVAAALTGLAALLHASAVAFEALKWLGVLYLLYMAWGMFNDTGSLGASATETRKPPLRVLVDGVTLNLLNPKLSIFFVAFLPQFVSRSSVQPIADMLMLSLAFMAVTFVVFAVYGALAGTFRKHVMDRPSILVWLRRSFAVTFGVLAAKLAVSGR